MSQPNIIVALTERVKNTLQRGITALLPEEADPDPLIRPSDRADLQANAALSLAKQARRRPTELASEIVARLADPVIAAASQTSVYDEVRMWSLVHKVGGLGQEPRIERKDRWPYWR